MVKVFADAGHHVLFTYFTGLHAAEQLENRWTNVRKLHLDQGDVKSVAAFAAVVNRWGGQGGVNVLINNAALGSATVQDYAGGEVIQNKNEQGISNRVANGMENGVANRVANGNGNLEHTNSDDHSAVVPDSVSSMLARAALDEALLRVNALGPLWVTHALMDAIGRAAETQRATIMFIGSVGGGSSAVFPEYCAADLMSKAAVTYLSKHLAAEHHRDNIHIMCLSPGATETDMFRKSTLDNIADVKRFVDTMPKGRLIQPDDVANSAFWLCTQPCASIFHGAVLDASMGLAVRPGLQTETNGTR